jgi:tRNA pseudouridine13 synthase
MYIIKQIPEDFVVQEQTSLQITSETIGFPYAVFILRKKEMTTEDAVQAIVRILGIRRKAIGIAGIKDRNAITEQYISILHPDKKKLASIVHKKFMMTYVGQLNKPISLGDLIANHFEIVVRNLDADDINRFDENLKLLQKNDCMVPNYFDEQRFSSNNLVVGKLILRKEFQKALALILENEKQKNSALHDALAQHLEHAPNDFVGALKTLPKKNLQLYIHAVQSYLFNETLKEWLLRDQPQHQKKKSKQPLKKRKDLQVRIVPYSLGEFLFPAELREHRSLEIVGFGSEYSGKEKEIIQALLKRESLSLQDFVVRQIPEISGYGTQRESHCKISTVDSTNPESDELNDGKKKMVLRFELPKGAYATIVVKYLFS